MRTVSYNKRRKKFFEAKLKETERKLKWWADGKRLGNKSFIQIDDMCTKYGMEMSFYKDALDALERDGVSE